MAFNYTPAYMTPKPEDKPYSTTPFIGAVASAGGKSSEDIASGGGGWGNSPASAPVINRPVITPTKEATKTAAWDFGPQSVVDNGPEGTAAAKAKAEADSNKSTIGDFHDGLGLTVQEQMDMAQKQMDAKQAEEDKKKGIIRPVLSATAPTPIVDTKTEAQIREEELARQRARIDAVNQLYVDEYRKAKERAMARTGTQRAQSAARGTIGSDFGTAEQQAVTDINVGEEDAIRAKQKAEIQAIMNESDKSIQDRVAKAQALILAQQERADKLKQEQDQLAIQTGQLDLAKEKAKQDAIAAGIKPIETSDGNLVNAMTGKVIYRGTPKAPTYGAGSVGEYQFYADQEKAAGRTPMNFSDYQTADANRKAAVAKITAGGLNSVQQSAAFKLVDDYEKASGDIQKQIGAYNRVVASAQNPSAAGDLSLIFNYMKILDPGSTVREGEFATAANSGTLGDKITNIYNKVMEGTRLTDQQRKDFVDRATNLYSSAIEQQKQVDRTYTDRAQNYGIPSAYVVRNQTSENINTVPNNANKTLLDYFNKSTPEVQARLRKMESDNPNLTDEDILKIEGVSFNNDLSTSGNRSTGKIVATMIGTRTVKVDSSIADKLAQADSDYFAATGKHIQVNQDLRTPEQQQELYSKFKAGTGGRAAAPGHSFHEKGLAVDVTNWKEAQKYLEKYGFKNPLADDKGHFSIGEFA